GGGSVSSMVIGRLDGPHRQPQPDPVALPDETAAGRLRFGSRQPQSEAGPEHARGNGACGGGSGGSEQVVALAQPCREFGFELDLRPVAAEVELDDLSRRYRAGEGRE